MFQRLIATLLLLVGILGVQSCSYTVIPENWGPHLHFRDELSRILIMFGEQMRCKRQWVLEDVQVKYNKEVHKILIYFRSQDIYELCDARKVLVDTVDELLDQLNSHPMVMADHDGEEFTYLDLEVRIKCTNFVQLFVDPMYIAWFDLHDGVSSFYAGSTLSFMTDPWTSWFKRREYFHQSRVIVYAQREAEAIYCPDKEREEKEKSKHLEADIFRS